MELYPNDIGACPSINFDQSRIDQTIVEFDERNIAFHEGS